MKTYKIVITKDDFTVFLEDKEIVKINDSVIKTRHVHAELEKVGFSNQDATKLYNEILSSYKTDETTEIIVEL